MEKEFHRARKMEILRRNLVGALSAWIFGKRNCRVQARPCLFRGNSSLRCGGRSFSSQGFAEVTPDISSAGFVPYAEAGLIVYDGQGNAPSGRFTVNTTTANGGSFQGIFTGTYIVNGDCTGTLQIDLGDGTLFHFDLVIEGSARHTAV